MFSAGTITCRLVVPSPLVQPARNWHGWMWTGLSLGFCHGLTWVYLPCLLFILLCFVGFLGFCVLFVLCCFFFFFLPKTFLSQCMKRVLKCISHSQRLLLAGMILLCLCYHWRRAKNASLFWKTDKPQTQLDYFHAVKTISSPAMCCSIFRVTVALPAIQT